MAIPTISEGMKWGTVFDILNQLITAVNNINDTFGNALAEGSIDYNVITNRPRINGVELTDDKSQDDLGIKVDSVSLARISRCESRLDNSASSVGELNTRAGNLEQFQSNANMRMNEQQEGLDALGDETRTSIESLKSEVNESIQQNANTLQNVISRQNEDSAVVSRLQTEVEELPESATVQDIVTRLNQVIHRLNDTANVALCGESRPGVCPSPISDLVIR